MEATCENVLLGLDLSQKLPDSLATDPQAIDWLFHQLQTQEFPPADLIEFLWKHGQEDRRFRLWKNRAFRPGLGEDGMASLAAYRFVEKNEPEHPWLDPFMEQAAYGFHRLVDGFSLGKDFQVHLKNRFERWVGSYDPEAGSAGKTGAMDSAALVRQVPDSLAILKDRLAAVAELFERNEFDLFFDGKLDFEITRAVKELADSRASPALLAAARRSLVGGKDLHLAFEILLARCSGHSELVDLFERSVELKWPGKARFLETLKRLGNSITPATVRRIVLLAAEENRYTRAKAVPMLLHRSGDDPEVIGRIKSWVGEATDDYGFSNILSCLLDANREWEWVRETALEFQKHHDGSHEILGVLARIGDEACIQVVLSAFDSSLSSEASGAINAAGFYLHGDVRVRERLIGKAREGSDSALYWIARRYPEEPATQQILDEASRKPGPGWLVRIMCIQAIRLPKLRERFLRSLRDPSTRYRFDGAEILALRPERELLAGEILENWERLSFHHAEFSSTYPMWFSWEPVMDQLIERIRSGDLLESPREAILQISECIDVSEALRDGIRAAADKLDLKDAILLLGLIYGDRPETVGFFKEFIEYEPAMSNYGAEVAFAEVIRLGKRGEDDFQWALTALRNSRRGSGGIACYGPRLLVHFFGRSPQVVEALQGLAVFSAHPPLADTAMRLLLNEFPEAAPEDLRATVGKMPAERRANYFRCLGDNVRHHLGELMHFALQDPETSVRKAAMLIIFQSVNWKKLPEEWSDHDFAMKCLCHEELADSAAWLLAKWQPEDEAVARLLVSAAERFPKTGISLSLAESFGHTETGREIVLETVRKSRQAAAALTAPPRCKCPGCIGFDLKEYVALMLRLHFPPFDEIPEAVELTRNILTDPWLESCDSWRLIPAVTYGLEDAGKLLKYEEIIRGEALEPHKKSACEALARMAGNNDEALESLLGLMGDPDEKLRMLAAKSSGSIALNERRNHRKLQERRKSLGHG